MCDKPDEVGRLVVGLRVDFFLALLKIMGNAENVVNLKFGNNCTVVYGSYLPEATKAIEREVVVEKTEKLHINTIWQLDTFPCITFLKSLKIDRVRFDYLYSITKAIESMRLLEVLEINIMDVDSKHESLSVAMSDHPSLRKIRIGGKKAIDIALIVNVNPKITDICIDSEEYSETKLVDALVNATHIEKFECRMGTFFKNREDLIGFVENNRNLRKLWICVDKTVDVADAIDHANSLESAYLCCKDDSDLDKLHDSATRLVERCKIKMLSFGNRENATTKLSRKYINQVIENSCAIHHHNLPTWNHDRAEKVSDVCVYVGA